MDHLPDSIEVAREIEVDCAVSSAPIVPSQKNTLFSRMEHCFILGRQRWRIDFHWTCFLLAMFSTLLLMEMIVKA